MARRGENIRKRKDGRWEGRYSVYDVSVGKCLVHSVYGKTYMEAKDKLFAIRQYSGLGEESGEEGSGTTFQAVAREWLDHVKGCRKYATYRKYRSIYEKYLAGKLGRLPLAKLNNDRISRTLERTGYQNLSASMYGSVSSVVNQILAYGWMQYHIGPAGYKPRKQYAEMKPLEILNHTQQARLLRCLYDEMDAYKLGILLCISTGLRLGEICALKWEDIDMEEKLLHVNATVQRIAVDGGATKTILMEGTPKSIFSKREIPLSDEMMKLLQIHSGRGRYVINRSRPMDPRTYQNRFQRYLEEAGIERKNFHILRHTFATNCVAGGADIKSLSEILGHSDVKITLNRYVHPAVETKRQHLNALSAVYEQYLGN